MKKLFVLLAVLAGTVVLAPAAHATNDLPKVTICHKPGTPAEQTKTVPITALGGHLGHGDIPGACPNSPDPVPGPPGEDGLTPLALCAPGVGLSFTFDSEFVDTEALFILEAEEVCPLAGADGKDGVDGTDGIDGAPGPAGPPGESVVGPVGPAGPTGEPGPAGKDGVTITESLIVTKSLPEVPHVVCPDGNGFTFKTDPPCPPLREEPTAIKPLTELPRTGAGNLLPLIGLGLLLFGAVPLALGKLIKGNR